MPLIITFLFFLTLSPLSAWADFDGEIPPSIMSMLDDASTLENKGTNNTFWKAAQKYCEASRAGNTEAQYRLGILYAFGRGVPQNRVYAATLFSIASNQGHLEAFNMLETVNLDAHSPPPCVIASIDPEIGDHFQSALDSLNNPINNHLKDYLAKLPKEKKWVLDLVESTSEWYEIDPKLVLSVIAIESNFNLNAKSNANAQGLMQLIPQTANRFNVKNAFDASQNVKGGVKYLKWLINRYQGNVELAIAAYNAGEKSVDRHHGIPPFKETIQYVKKFQNLYQKRFHPYQINP